MVVPAADASEGVVRFIDLPEVVEARGSLLPLDFAVLPFAPRRVFVVRDVPPGTTRGGHVHRTATQLLVRLVGSITVEVRHTAAAQAITLADSRTGLLIPAGVWSSQTYLTPDAALLVLCDEPYDPSGYSK